MFLWNTVAMKCDGELFLVWSQVQTNPGGYPLTTLGTIQVSVKGVFAAGDPSRIGGSDSMAAIEVSGKGGVLGDGQEAIMDISNVELATVTVALGYILLVGHVCI